MKENWIEKINKPSEIEKKFSFIDEFKKRIFKKYKLKKGTVYEIERWAYYEKRFGYLMDTYEDKTYEVDFETGEIKIEKK